MPCPYPLPTHRSVCASGLAHRPGRWSAGKMPAPEHNRGGSGTRPYPDQHHSPVAIHHSLFAIRHSLFAIRCLSPLATRRSPRAVDVHKRRLSGTSADCRGTACRAPTPYLPTGPCARAAWLFAAGAGPPARCGATTQPGRVWDPPLPGPAPFTSRCLFRCSLLAARCSPLAARCLFHSPSFPFLPSPSLCREGKLLDRTSLRA
jgi:hypothetical protein